MIGRIGRGVGSASCVATIYANGNDIRKCSGLEPELVNLVSNLGQECIRRGFLKHMTPKSHLTRNVLRPVGFHYDHQCCSFCASECVCAACTNTRNVLQNAAQSAAPHDVQPLPMDEEKARGAEHEMSGWPDSEYHAGRYSTQGLLDPAASLDVVAEDR